MSLSKLFRGLVALAGVAFALPSHAWFLEGSVFCDVNQNQYIDGYDTVMPNVTVLTTDSSGAVYSAASGSSGYYHVSVPGTGSYTAALAESTLPVGSTYVIPAGGSLSFVLTDNTRYIEQHWLLAGPTCQQVVQQGCWLTAGGAKFQDARGPVHSLGGNVFPSCSQKPGNGGQWTHVAHTQRLHFLGSEITEVACGNVNGIPPGSTSPVTPYNFIEFRGTGSLMGIKGNTADYEHVYFSARAEDRGEPGTEDRYFLHVYTDPANPAGSTLLLVDQDGSALTRDPLTMTGGNLQLHASSCQ